MTYAIGRPADWFETELDELMALLAEPPLGGSHLDRRLTMLLMHIQSCRGDVMRRLPAADPLRTRLAELNRSIDAVSRLWKQALDPEAQLDEGQGSQARGA